MAAAVSVTTASAAVGEGAPARPAPAQVVATPAPRQVPGPGVAWAPAGRSVLGGPVLYLGRVGAAQVAWMSPELVRVVVVPGSRDRGIL